MTVKAPPKPLAHQKLGVASGRCAVRVPGLGGSLLLLGTAEWPRARFSGCGVAAATVIFSIGTTAYSEHLNMARGAWTNSDLMPLFPGTGIGLVPLAQWIVIPLLALVAARSVHLIRGLDLATIGITTSGSLPDHLVRSNPRPS